MQFRLFATLALLTLLPMIPACTPPQKNLVGSSTESSNGASGQTSEPAPSSEVSSAEAAATPANSDRNSPVELTVADLAKLSEIVKSHAGKVVVVDVWSTSCAPCMREFPHLVTLSQTDSDKLTCISLNVDYIGLKSQPPESYSSKVQKFLQQQQADQVTNLLSASTDEAVLGEFELESIPAILIYAADGTLKHALTDANSGSGGLTYEGEVVPKVKALLAAL